jgi:hypothetical protein
MRDRSTLAVGRVDQLVALGYLQSTERNDLDAIKAAASEVFSDALSCWDGHV